MTVGDVAVTLPPNPFLQSTRQGEEALQERVLKIVGKAKKIADLFSGVGTFALPLARKAQTSRCGTRCARFDRAGGGGQVTRAEAGHHRRSATCSKRR